MNTQIFCLERHLYAPELNTIHFVDGSTFSVPGITTIPEAIKFMQMARNK